MSDIDDDLEPIYIAGNVREIASIEELLNREGIDYEARPGEFIHERSFGSVFQGIVFNVLEGQADDCRRRLVEAGFISGIIQRSREC
jgi:hypothetical protein